MDNKEDQHPYLNHRKRSSIRIKKEEYDPDIFDAVEFGDLESIRMYWAESIDIDYQDSKGKTLLMIASFYGFEEIVEFLLDFNPNISLEDKDGQTALGIAIQNRHKKVSKLLFEAMNNTT